MVALLIFLFVFVFLFIFLLSGSHVYDWSIQLWRLLKASGLGGKIKVIASQAVKIGRATVDFDDPSSDGSLFLDCVDSFLLSISLPIVFLRPHFDQPSCHSAPASVFIPFIFIRRRPSSSIRGAKADTVNSEARAIVRFFRLGLTYGTNVPRKIPIGSTSPLYSKPSSSKIRKHFKIHK